MPDETKFEPRLGSIGRDRARRPATQLRALSKLARQGKPRIFGRTRLAPGTVRFYGRGKGAAVTARLWADASLRHVIVKTTISPARGNNTSAFAGHVKYIHRDGTDENGSRAALYDREDENVSERSFNTRSRDDAHQFRIMVSPRDADRMEDLTAFTRKLMNQAERDLGARLDWVAINHYNTPQPHVHIVVRGRNSREGILVIDRAYLTHGLRYRAQDLVTRELGHKTSREISAGRSQDASAEQFTAIDKELSRAARAGRLRLSPSASSLDRYDRGEKLHRLRQLRTLGLARHIHGSEWSFTEGWTETLKSLGQRTDILNTLERDTGKRLDIRSIEKPSPGSVGGWITGRLASIMANGRSDTGQMVLVEGLDGRLWTFPLSDRSAAHLPDPGAVISVYMPASQPVLPATRGVGATGEESQPSDPNLPILVNSWLPIDALTERRAFTWLDEIDETFVGQLANGFGGDVRAAKSVRQAFLQASRLDPSAREELIAAELRTAADAEARRSGKRYVVLANREVFRGEYTANIDTAHGRFAVIANEGRFILAPFTEELAPWRGQSISVAQPSMSQEIVLARGRGIER